MAEGAFGFAGLARFAHPVLVNGSPGFVVAPQGRPFAVIGFTVARGRIVEIDILADPTARRRRANLGETDRAAGPMQTRTAAIGTHPARRIKSA